MLHYFVRLESETASRLKTGTCERGVRVTGVHKPPHHDKAEPPMRRMHATCLSHSSHIIVINCYECLTKDKKSSGFAVCLCMCGCFGCAIYINRTMCEEEKE